jgi:glucose-1-phosphate thymidylyltransferase
MLLLGDGSQYGINIEYMIQREPKGIAQAFIIGEEFIGDDDVCLVLGDNLFYGHGFSELLQKSISNVKEEKVATVFGYWVKDPERYGVAEFDNEGNVVSIEEKPNEPKSNYAVPGLYFYDNSVVDIARNIKPSDRGELEITDVNRVYLEKEMLNVAVLSRGTAWLDTGTFGSLMQAGEFVRVIEERQGQKIGCIEEVAYNMGYIDGQQLLNLAEPLAKSGYGLYLKELVK